MQPKSIAIALVALAMSAGVTRSQDWSVITEELKDTTLIVERQNKGDGKPLKRGSGFVISSSGYLLTAKHVIEGYDDSTQQLRVGFSNGGLSLAAARISCSPDVDACLLKMHESDLREANRKQFAELSCRRLRPPDHIFIVGWPGHSGHDRREKAGSVVGSDLIGLVQVDALSMRGMSGAAVFDASGRIVGLVMGGLGESENETVVVPLHTITQIGQVPEECSRRAAPAIRAAEAPREDVISRAKSFTNVKPVFRTFVTPADEGDQLSALEKLPKLSISADVELAPGAGGRKMSAHTLELNRGGFTTNGEDLTIEVIDLISNGGYIRAFAQPNVALPGRDGANAGTVRLIVHGKINSLPNSTAERPLRVDLSGQKGADGAPGARGSAGRAGQPGEAAASSAFDCSRGPGNGRAGESGGQGQRGGPAKNGGAGGVLELQSPDPVSNAEQIAAVLTGGAAGVPGPGGLGGPGGPGGPAGSASGWCQQTAQPGAPGREGERGETGPAGVAGNAGRFENEFLAAPPAAYVANR